MGEKPFATYRTQLSILRSRGMIVPTNGSPMRVLEKENYYNVINGYKDLFLDSKKTATTEEKYKIGTHFSEVYALYKFDCEIKNIFLKRLLRIENHIKTAIAYNFSNIYSRKVKNCLLIENFDLTPGQKETSEGRYSNVMKLLTSIQGEVSRQIKSNDSIRHYMLEYGYVPLWVLMNVLSFGTVSKFYRYMKQPDKQQISKIYNVSDSELGTILKVLSLVRNLCAHDERLFNFRSRDYIKTNWVHRQLGGPTNSSGPIYGRNDLYAILICIRLLTSKTEIKKMSSEITKEIKTLEKELKVIDINEVLDKMGFPSNWDKIKSI